MCIRDSKKAYKKRAAKPNKKNIVSDEVELAEREDRAVKLVAALEGCDTDPLSLPLATAVGLHMATDNNDVRRALRVVTAMRFITSDSVEGKMRQLGEFTDQLTAFLKEELDMDLEKTETVRSCFIKAAHHRVCPEKHESKAVRERALESA